MIEIAIAWPHFMFWGIYILVIALAFMGLVSAGASSLGVAGAFVSMISGLGVILIGIPALILNTIAYLIWLQWWIPLGMVIGMIGLSLWWLKTKEIIR